MPSEEAASSTVGEYEDGETMILARVPIYGTPDAGRFFWKQFKEVIAKEGFRENDILKAFYCLTAPSDGQLICVLGTQGGGMMWAAMDEAETAVQNILKAFDCRKIEENEFRFCGKEIKQEETPRNGIHVMCKDTTKR